MKRVVVGLFFGLLLLSFTTGNCYAEKSGRMGKGIHKEGACMGHDGGGMMRAEHRIWKALKDLGLDEKQKEAIKEIKSRVKKDIIKKRADLQIARVELKDILDKEPVDMAAVEAKLKQLESMRTDLHITKIKALEEIKATLTPEQKQKFKDNLKKHWRRHGRWTHEGKEMAPVDKKKGK